MEWLGKAGGQEKADPPYSAVTSSRKLWEHHLDRHHSHVLGARAVVDHFTPKCQDPRMQRVQESSRRFHVNERQAEIGRENRKLVDRLASISGRNSGGGCGGPPPGASRSRSQPPIASSLLHEPLRRRVSQGIQQDNEQLVRRILAVKTNMNIRGMERDFKKHQKYSQNLRRITASPPRRSTKPRSLPPLHERVRPASDPSRPPEGLFVPGDLRRLPRSESASTLQEPLPRPVPGVAHEKEAPISGLGGPLVDSDDNTSPLAATEPLPSLPGSPGQSPGGGGVVSGRPPRPEVGSRKGNDQVPLAPSLERKESEMSDQQWQQVDTETDRRSWIPNPKQTSDSGPKPGKRQRPGDTNKSNVSGTSDSELKYEDDWDDWSQDSPSRTGSLSQTLSRSP